MSGEPGTPEPWEGCEEEPQRDVLAAELVENHLPGTRNFVADALAAAVGRALEQIEQGRAEEGEPPLPDSLRATLTSATTTVVGALEGALKGKSLEGALKEAQILALFAEARERNAAALEHEANAAFAREQTRKLAMETAWAQLTNVLSLIRSLGVKVELIRLPDGRTGIAIGENIAAVVPGLLLAGPVESAGVPISESVAE